MASGYFDLKEKYCFIKGVSVAFSAINTQIKGYKITNLFETIRLFIQKKTYSRLADFFFLLLCRLVEKNSTDET